MSQTIEEIEERDGVRLTWNVWPVSPSSSETVPIACLYNVHQPAPLLPYEPIVCHGCQSILCPQSIIDFGSYSWTCVFCDKKNALPAYARDITPENVLPEMLESNSTVEYLLSRGSSFPAVYMLLADCCTYDEERHQLLKRSIHQALDEIPGDALVGLIKFGTNIELMGFSEEKIQTVYLFSGKTEYTAKDVPGMNISDMRRFLAVKSEFESTLRRFIDELEPDPFPVMTGFRSTRSTGSAVSLAVSLLEGTFADSPAKCVLFTQGPCTYGPGKVSVQEISATATERLDLSAAEQFYRSLGERMNNAGHSLDIVAETIADIGLEQMKGCITLTGGTIIMAQDFDETIVTGSIKKLFARAAPEEGLETPPLAQGYNAKVQVRTSPNLIYRGIVGEGRAYGTGWKIGSIMPHTNLTVLLENTPGVSNGSFGHVQIITQYQQSNKRILTRVTSFSRMFSSDRPQLCGTFDQEAACVFQARALLAKGFQNVLDFESGIDKNLLRFLRRYSNFVRGDPDSVKLPEAMSYYPNFMYFFRRSLLVQKDGISEDESAYFRIMLYKLPTGEAIKMIKPPLISFHYQGNVVPVELDAASLDPEAILVLDSFHNVLLWRGAYVSNWIQEGLHEKEEYAFFKQAISDASEYAHSLLDRLPVPQFKETDEGRSQARILLHYVNPSLHGAVITEKIDYDLFYKTLCRYIVKNE